jgi:PAS domain S-box-containing protein
MSEPRWQLLIDVLPDGFILVDRAGLIRYLNPAAESAIELLRTEVLGRPLADLVGHARIELSFLLDAFAGAEKVSRTCIGPSGGQTYNVSTRAIRDWQGHMTCFIVVVRNLTEAIRKDSYDSANLSRDPAAMAGVTSTGSLETVVLCGPTATLVERGLRTLQLGSRLLVLGESGVGKTEFARLLHRKSGSATRPFVHVNCGSIPESLFESEMFGYERGSFTGALAKGKRGLVEAADGGVLFLDEVGEIPLTSQAKMLQFLEEGGVQRVGATQIRRLRVQIITATNRDLRQMVAAGTFRADLFYRLSVVTLRMPPLRECTEMLDSLIDRFLAHVERRRGAPLHLDRSARRKMHAYGFPGNIRELQNLIDHLAIVTDGPVKEADITAALDQLGASGAVQSANLTSASADLVAGDTLGRAVRRYEAELIRKAIAKMGSKRKAAELLGVDIATVVRKSRELDS